MKIKQILSPAVCTLFLLYACTYLATPTLETVLSENTVQSKPVITPTVNTVQGIETVKTSKTPLAGKFTPEDTPKPENVRNGFAGQVLFIFGEGYDHRHYEGTRRSLEKSGYRVMVASSTTDPLEGVITSHGFELNSQIGRDAPMVKPDLKLEDVEVNDFHAVIFISDSGLLADRKSVIKQIITKAVTNGVVLAAQEFSIYHLAESGVLKAIRVTANPLICQELEKIYGAECTLMPVQHDQCIVTTDPTYSTVSFVRAILVEIESCRG